jgi:hypothetical protein
MRRHNFGAIAMLDIQFHVTLPDGRSAPETDLPTDGKAAEAMIDDFSGASGAIVITRDDGARTAFADTLRILVPTFCLGGLAELVRDGQKSVDCYDHEVTARLIVRDSMVIVSGDQIETRALPLVDYVATQKACGERYVSLARRIWQGVPERAGSLAMLVDGLAKASAL